MEQSGDNMEWVTRRRLVGGIAGVALTATAGCSGGSDGSDTPENTVTPTEAPTDENTPTETPTETPAPRVDSTDIEIQAEDPLNPEAIITAETNRELDTDLTASIQLNGEQYQDLQLPQKDGDTYTGNIEIPGEGEITTQIQGTIDGELEDTTDYQLFNDLTLEQNNEAPGRIQAILEPTETGLEAISQALNGEPIEAELTADGETQTIQLTQEEDGEDEGEYQAETILYENGEIPDQAELTADLTEKLGLQLLPGHTQTQTDLEDKQPFKHIYNRTGSGRYTVSIEDLETVQNGEIQDWDKFVKESARLTEGWEDNSLRPFIESYKQIAEELDLTLDEFSIVKRKDTAGVDYAAITYGPEGETKKAVASSWPGKEEAPALVLIEDEEAPNGKPSEMFNYEDLVAIPARGSLHGLHDTEDDNNIASLDFQQYAEIVEEEGTKEEYSQEEWEEGNAVLDDYNDLLVVDTPEDSSVGYTLNVRGYMGELIDRMDGPHETEVEAVEAATEYFHNAIGPGNNMQIDVAEQGEGEGEKLADLWDNKAMYAQPTGERNVTDKSQIYDPEAS
ncbi:hypothetical protein [Halovenus salina]|uniref:hypothetical protein n=1 Tax=Halovenus salina TaxID=1510225 RepID=UPI002260E7DB|nr:hypothetical protein [Halovenus salina]